MPVFLPCDRCIAVSLTGRVADRTVVQNGKRMRENVYLVSAPFLTLCDYLMHRSLFFNKTTYESKVSADTRTAFINMSWDTHSAPEAREELAESWKGYLAYRRSNPAKGLPVATAGEGGPNADELINRMQTAPVPSAIGRASASAAAGDRAVAGGADGQGGGGATVQG